MNCPLPVDDMKRVLHVYRGDIESLKIKMTRRNPTPTNGIVETHIRPKILDLHPIINLSEEYLFVQGVEFLHIISRGYGFRTVEYLNIFKKRYNQVEMEMGIKRYIHLYHALGLHIAQLNIDNEFACIEEIIRSVRLDILAIEEYVEVVEISIRTVK